MRLRISVILMCSLLLPACALSSKSSSDVFEKRELKNYAKADIESHNHAEDCWLIIDNNVFDVTSFIDKHPGGKIIAMACGKDATILFHARGSNGEDHSDSAKKMKENFLIGTIRE